MTSEKLRSLREAAGLTALQLAEKAGLHVRTINQLEQGTRKGGNVATLAKLAKALKVKIERLM